MIASLLADKRTDVDGSRRIKTHKRLFSCFTSLLGQKLIRKFILNDISTQASSIPKPPSEVASGTGLTAVNLRVC